MGLIFQENKSLKQFTTFKIGGKARFFVEVKTENDLKAAFFWAQEHFLPVCVLGGGSNVLFDDRGFAGLVIRNLIDFLKETPKENSFQVGSGYNLTKLALETTGKNLSGLEFAAGIPATLGGAIYMNAGAFGFAISDILETVDFLFLNGEKRTFEKKELEFGYRFSSFQKLKGAVVSARLNFSFSFKAREAALAFLEKRKNTQPLKMKNAGSIFRNPSGYFAAELIEKANLKGVQIGGAKVSSMHANFIVNEKEAKSEEVLALIGLVKNKVLEKYQVNLQEELIYVPFSDS